MSDIREHTMSEHSSTEAVWWAILTRARTLRACAKHDIYGACDASVLLLLLLLLLGTREECVRNWAHSNREMESMSPLTHESQQQRTHHLKEHKSSFLNCKHILTMDFLDCET